MLTKYLGLAAAGCRVGGVPSMKFLEQSSGSDRAESQFCNRLQGFSSCKMFWTIDISES